MVVRKLAIVLFVLISAACDKEETPQTPIDSNIQIEAKEVVEGGTSRIVLVGKTEKEYTCSNNTIAASKILNQNTIQIEFKAIEGDSKCATALGPATTEIDLGMLSNGEYNLHLNTSTTENHGLLKVTTTEIMLEFDQQDGIDILTPVLQR